MSETKKQRKRILILSSFALKLELKQVKTGYFSLNSIALRHLKLRRKTLMVSDSLVPRVFWRYITWMFPQRYFFFASIPKCAFNLAMLKERRVSEVHDLWYVIYMYAKLSCKAEYLTFSDFRTQNWRWLSQPFEDRNKALHLHVCLENSC